jgi:hypothetical protein
VVCKQVKSSDKQLIIIFLDIDGVLFRERVHNAIQKRCLELYQQKGLTPPISFSTSDCDEAAVDLFDDGAVKNLQFLMKKIDKNGDEPRIVLSSSWRNGNIEY